MAATGPDLRDGFFRSWRNASHLRRWFDNQWLELRHSEIRHNWDDAGRWYCTFPDYDAGRSRVVGVEDAVLQRLESIAPVQTALENAGWRERINSEALLVTSGEHDTVRVVTWDPRLKEQWFPLPSGGHFVAYETTPHPVSSAGPSILLDPFLALDGKMWSASGPSNPRDPQTYTHPKWRRYRAAPVERIPRRYSGIVPFLRDIVFILRRLRYLRRGSMSGAFRERLILTVTAVNHCRYCAYSHTRLALRAGLKREAIESLLGGGIRDVPEREIPALLYARHWAENRARPDPEARHTLEQTYGSETAVTIEVVLRAIRMGNLTGNTLEALLCRASRGRFGRPAHTPGSAL